MTKEPKASLQARGRMQLLLLVLSILFWIAVGLALYVWITS